MAGRRQDNPEHTTAGHIRSGLAALAAVTVIVAHALTAGWVGFALTVTVTVVPIAMIAASTRRRRGRSRPQRAWRAMIAATGLFGLGTAIGRLAELRGADLAEVAAGLYGAGFAAYVVTARQLAPVRRDSDLRAELLDLIVLAATASIISWRLLWAPTHPPSATGDWFFLCLVAVTILLGGRILLEIVRTYRAHGRARPPAAGVLAVAGGLPLSIAAAGVLTGVSEGAGGMWFAAAWPLTAALLAAAALHPTMGARTRPIGDITVHLGRRRLWLVGAATVVPLLVGLLTDLTGEPGPYVFVIGIVINAMVILRADIAFRQTREELDGRIAAEAELAQQSRFDSLSGLPNRALFTSYLEEAVARAGAGGPMLAVLYLDLDRFKVVNDSFGPRAGDQVIVTVADRLRRAVRDRDTAARLSGDEFAVILDHLDSVDDARAIGERIRTTVREPIAVAATSIVVGASIGLSVYDGQAEPADLLREAGVALSDAKRQGRDTVTVFDAGLRAQIARSLAFEHDLVDAADRGELRLHYQPQIDLSSGTVCGMEALLRWQHPTHGLLGPDAFMDIAEDTGLIVPIGAWVIDEACRQHRRWQAALGSEQVPHIAVNVSPTQLARDDVAGRLKRALAATRLDAVQLHVEITEVALMGDPERAAEALRTISRQGVAVAVDDFGTGYFSLSHLRRFPVHRIKIDQSFVRGIGVNNEDEAIIDATIDLAHALGLSVVAEGVETTEQLDYVHRKGCDVVQGYLFAKPMPPHEMAGFLRHWAQTHGVARQPAPDRHREMAPITGPRARSLSPRSDVPAATS